jgi:signal transduction histidine kinase/CheY-like chemotaxis protein
VSHIRDRAHRTSRIALSASNGLVSSGVTPSPEGLARAQAITAEAPPLEGRDYHGVAGGSATAIVPAPAPGARAQSESPGSSPGQTASEAEEARMREGPARVTSISTSTLDDMRGNLPPLATADDALSILCAQMGTIPMLPTALLRSSVDSAIRASAEADALYHDLLVCGDTAQVVVDNCSVISRLLDDFLSLERIEQGSFTLEFATYSLAQLISDSIRIFSAPISLKRLNLFSEVLPGAPQTVCGDYAKTRQILCNFLSNAVKFSPSGGHVILRVEAWDQPAGGAGKATVGGETLPDEQTSERAGGEVLGRKLPAGAGAGTGTGTGTGKGTGTGTGAKPDSGTAAPPSQQQQQQLPPKRFRISVSDDGPGISPEDRERLFQPFVQIRPGEMQKGSGSGLGLSICKRIATAAGGRVGLTSKVGEGSTFFVELPVDGAGALNTRPQQSPMRVLMASPATAGGGGGGGGGGTGRLSPPSPRRLEQGRASGQSPRRASRLTVSSASPRGKGAPMLKSPLRAQATRGHALSPAPSLQPQQTQRQTPPSQVPPLPPPRKDLAPLHRAIVVDDDSATRSLFSRLLSRRGVTTVHTAEDGDAALAILQRLRQQEEGREASTMSTRSTSTLPQAVFLDREMPRMSGSLTARAFREQVSSICLIGITGNALREDLDEFCEAGVDAVITKPVSATDLDSALAGCGLCLPSASRVESRGAGGAEDSGATRVSSGRVHFCRLEGNGNGNGSGRGNGGGGKGTGGKTRQA